MTLASIPLQSFFSTVSLYNLAALLSFVLAGFGMFRLALFLGIGRPGAVVAGIAYTFSPYHFSHALGHLNQISYQWIPFFLLAYLQGWNQGLGSSADIYGSSVVAYRGTDRLVLFCLLRFCHGHPAGEQLA